MRNQNIGCIIYFQFCTLGLQQKLIWQQHVAGMYKACRDLHQVDTGATVVTEGVELSAAVGVVELGAGVTGTDVVRLSCIMITILSTSGRP